MGKLTTQELGTFLEGMERESAISPGEKTVVATVIMNHGGEIDTYIKKFEKSDVIAEQQHGRKLRRLVEQNSSIPRGQYYSEPLSTLFQDNPVFPDASEANWRALRAAQYVFLAKRIAALVMRAIIMCAIGFVMYVGYLASQKGGTIAGERISRLEQLIYELEHPR